MQMDNWRYFLLSHCLNGTSLRSQLIWALQRVQPWTPRHTESHTCLNYTMMQVHPINMFILLLVLYWSLFLLLEYFHSCISQLWSTVLCNQPNWMDKWLTVQTACCQSQSGTYLKYLFIFINNILLEICFFFSYIDYNYQTNTAGPINRHTWKYIIKFYFCYSDISYHSNIQGQ